MRGLRQFRALLSVQLKAALSVGTGMGRRSRKKTFSGISVMAVMAGLCAYLSGLYSFLFASALAPAGQLAVLFLIMPVLAVVLGTFFTLFAAQGVVFGGRDNDLVLALPVSPFVLMLARSAALYLENLLTTAFILLPAGGVFLWYGGEGGARLALRLLAGTAVLAVLPTVLALAGGFVLAWLTSRLRSRSGLTMVCYGLFFALIFAMAFRLNALIADLVEHAAGLRQGFAGWGIPFLLMQDWVCGGAWSGLLGLIGIAALPFLGAVWGFGGRYKAIVTGLTARGARSDYKLERVSAGSVRRALLAKEAGRFFHSPMYLFNAGIGLIFLVAAGVASVVFRARLAGTISLLAAAGVELPLTPLLTGMVCLMLGTAAITSSSISLEGKYLWILKEAPVPVGWIFGAKVLFQLLLALPCGAVCLAGTGFALALPPAELLLAFGVCAAFAGAAAVLGLLVNLCFPKLDASNDAVVVKQSAASFIGSFGGMLLAVALGGLWYLLRGPAGSAGALALCGGVCALLALIALWLLGTVGKRKFLAL